MDLQFKEKSKRGRKPKNIKINLEDEQQKDIVKKRGRKPKPKHPLELLPKLPKKRGRKPKDKYGIITDKNLYYNEKPITEDNENIILHLPIHSSQILDNGFFEQSLLEYNPHLSVPVPYEGSMDFSQFENITNLSEENIVADNNIQEETQNINDSEETDDVTNTIQIRETYLKYNGENIFDDNHQENELMLSNYKENEFEIQVSSCENKKISNTMIPFQEANKHKKWPEKTNIHCWWCCTPFDNTPFSLPIKKIDNEYLVKGCFCSPECTAAWNFDNQGNDSKWESYSLLNILYKKYYKGVAINIKIAPPKECLQKFGGNLTIEEFRENNTFYNIEHKIINPPMISIIPQVEESNVNFIIDNNSIPLDEKRLEKANKELKLKREKPLINKINTLEDCMKLKYI